MTAASPSSLIPPLWVSCGQLGQPLTRTPASSPSRHPLPTYRRTHLTSSFCENHQRLLTLLSIQSRRLSVASRASGSRSCLLCSVPRLCRFLCEHCAGPPRVPCAPVLRLWAFAHATPPPERPSLCLFGERQLTSPARAVPRWEGSLTALAGAGFSEPPSQPHAHRPPLSAAHASVAISLCEFSGGLPGLRSV